MLYTGLVEKTQQTPHRLFGRAAVRAELHGTPFVDLAAAQWLLRDERDLMPFVELVRKASDEFIEMARPQLFQVAFCIDEAIRSRHFIHGYESNGILKARTFAGACDRIVMGAAAEGRAHLDRTYKVPGDKDALRGAAAALAVIAGARTVGDAVRAAEGPHGVTWRERADDAWTDLAALARALRSGVGSIHADVVHSLLPDPDEIAAQARVDTLTMLESPPYNIDKRRIRTVIGLTGNWEPGERMLHHEKLRKPDTGEAPLSARDVARLREAAASLMADYDSTYQRPGFVNLLRQAIGMSVHSATWAVDRATVANASLKAACDLAAEAALPNRYSGTPRTLKEEIAGIETREASTLSAARKELAFAQACEAWLGNAARAAGFVPDIRTLVSSDQDGITVLRFADERPEDAILAIYPETGREGSSYPNAVFAARLYGPDMAAGLPSLEEVKERPGMGTNFRNMEDALSHVSSPEMQELVFGGPVAIENIAGPAVTR
jgi:hypothetical protein